MKLKRSKTADIDYLWATYKSAMKAHIEQIWGWDLAWQKLDFSKNLDKYTSSLITKHGETIGYVQYKVKRNHVYVNMLILEASQQSQGTGAEVLNYLISKFNPETLSLRCFKVNKRAFRFYLREGFEIIDEDEHFYLLETQIRKTCILKLDMLQLSDD